MLSATTSSLRLRAALAKSLMPTPAVVAAVGITGAVGYGIYHYRTRRSDQLSQLAGFHKPLGEDAKADAAAEKPLPPGIPDMPPADIDRRLALGESSLAPASSRSSVLRVDVCELASNDPIEDRHIEQALSGDAALLGIFDGHWDVHCVNAVAAGLPQYVRKSLSAYSDPGKALLDAFEKFDADLLALPAAVIKGFNDMTPEQIAALPLDQRVAARDKLLAALNGACAVMSYIKNDDLYIAHAGDCRAVLGSLGADGRWQATVLTEDHQPSNDKELAYLKANHPGEDKTIAFRRGPDDALRVIGHLMPSRAFGDARYKWPLDVQAKITALIESVPRRKHHWKLAPHCYTPPYLRATPDIVHRKLTSQDQFLVLASDGIFDELSSERVVEIIGDFLQHAPLTSSSSTLCEIRHPNAATHVVRQALKGGDLAPDSKNGDRYVSRMLTMTTADARDWRDDMTIQIILFKPAEKQLRDNWKKVQGVRKLSP
ncbi:hypothetical protein HK105_203159 [Polyrhizophydium stewartii]|uniref:PPM-type phosphatase domain-containing protein n=1 Tax=Polyrhizophydium stewartii TaxID=2732419 RepID=A0ABR4NC29_9FUNG